MLCGRESKAGAGPASADAGARQGRAAKITTVIFECLTDPCLPRARHFPVGSQRQKLCTAAEFCALCEAGAMFCTCKTARRGLRPNFATAKFELWATKARAGSFPKHEDLWDYC